MSPRQLQQTIHSTFSANEATWENFRADCVELLNSAENGADFRSHLIREFNRKVLSLGFSSLAFSPYDGGYRYIGDLVQTDEDALAYAATTGLTGDPLDRLSNMLTEIKAAGVDLKLVTLGRSEFLARSGSTHRAVIGPNATITGTLGNTADGIEFDTGSGDIFEFDNPSPFTSGFIWQLVVAIPDVLPASYYALISGALSATTLTGPEIRLLSSKDTQYRITSGPSGTPIRTRSHRYVNGNAGVPMLYGGQLENNGNISPIKDLLKENISVGGATGWNNVSKWRLGSSLSNFGRMDGKISIALAGLGSLSIEQIYRVSASIVRNNMGSISPPRWIGFIGDSMTVGTAGIAGGDPTRSCLWTTLDSGWKGSFWDMRAIGGTPWFGASPTQEEFFQEMLARMAWVPDMPRTIVFWPGYNTTVMVGTEQERRTLADAYVDAAAQAAAVGIQTVHWSSIAGVQGTSYVANVNEFNDYYKTQIALLDGDHIFYDHRDTFSAGEFDGSATINPAYFADQIHLTATGIAVLTADFLTKHPNP